ncbi:MAG TPA: TonB family protein [Polyangia bacterium]|jgi:protein TonB|nr:TonB family protein [Polyangia bacterium]
MSLGKKSQHAERSGRPRSWAWALAGSSAVHFFVLAVLLRGGLGAADDVEAASVVVELKPVEVAATEPDPSAALPDPPLPAVDEAKVTRPLDAPEGDRDNAVPKTVGPREGDSRARGAPAPDQGESGARLTGLAMRHDRSTLESRVADSEDAAQLSRLHTSRRSASPQAVRRERRIGIGDSVRTSEATRARSATRPQPPAGASDAPPDVAGQTVGAKPPAMAFPVALARVSDHPQADRGQGPLDAERGARAFDVEARGRAAVDDETRRAASHSSHPGITDFSQSGVAGDADSRQGRGPGEAPGAVARPSSGTAPTAYGARSPAELAAEAAQRERERVYDRYRQEIQRRVQNVLVFPKVLALRLEQGETVVTFIVRPDGALGEGPRIVKSSGFQEFDAEAVRAVQRAAPFPRRPEGGSGLSLSMPVTFENPLVR